jgi:hypothetical protein
MLPVNISPVNPRQIIIAGCAGLVGGCVGGALGGVAVPSIQMMTAPPWDEAVRTALFGALVWGLVGSLGGIVVRFAAGRRMRSLLWTGTSAGLASLVAVVETAQTNAVRGALTFVLSMITLTTIGLAFHFIVKGVWRLRWLLLAWLAAAIVAEIYSRRNPAKWTATTDSPDELVVQLRCSTVPDPLRLLVVHYWFAVFDPETGHPHRWEVWQQAGAGGTSWGHVYKDLMDVDADTGGGPTQIRAEWHGPEARALAQALVGSPVYPDREQYCAWPGPNSNTYVAWVLRRAGVWADLEPRGIGKDYLGPAGVAITAGGTGAQVETSLLGLKVGVRDGIELHFLYFTLGLDALRPAVKTPFGRLGLP